MQWKEIQSVDIHALINGKLCARVYVEELESCWYSWFCNLRERKFWICGA